MKATQSPTELSSSALVRPRRESRAWLRLGRLLNDIHDAQEHAIHAGFCHGKTKRLDWELARLIDAATEARSLLRPNK